MPPKDDYISIADFARAAGVSAAAVYKRVNNPVDNQLITYVKMINGKKHINRAALELFNAVPIQPVDNQSIQPVDNQLITILQETLDTLKGELDTKNEQIKQLNDRLQEANQLNHQNQILLSEKQQPETIEAPAPPATVKSSRRWFDWFRKGDDKQ